MTSTRSTWTIHPCLEIELRTTRKRYRSYFENEYARVAVRQSGDPVRITAHIVRSLPPPQAGDVSRELTFKKIFHYEYIVRGLDSDHVQIYFKDHPLAYVYANIVTLFLQAQIIEPIAYYKLLERDVLFMHAAGVAEGDQAYLFPAFGGTGKTTLTLGLMGEGMQVLGDDLLLLDASTGVVRPYLRPLHLFAYNVRTLRGAKVPWSVRAQVRTKNVMRAVLERVTAQEFLISSRVHAEQLYPEFRVGSRSAVTRVVFLTKAGSDFTLSTRDCMDEIVDRILESEDLNVSLYQNVLGSARREACVALERAVIARGLAHVPEVSFVNTRRLDFNDLGGFRDWLVGGTAGS